MSAALWRVASSYTPLGVECLLLPASASEEDKILRAANAERYPQAAWVLAKGKEVSEEIKVGDLVMIEVESVDIARQYGKVFQIFFTDGQTAIFEPDIEPLVREVVEEFRANPATSDRRIRCLAVDGDGFQFLASDVLTYDWRETSSPEFNLLYPINTRMFWEWVGVNMQLFYVVKEENILGILP